MNVQEELRAFVCEHGLNALLKRMEARIDNHRMESLLTPTIVEATIVDIDKVIEHIKKTWTVFNIKDVRVNLKSQTVEFKIWGGPYWIPEKYNCYIVFPNKWSAEQTKENNYQRITKEQHAETNSLPLQNFIGNGINVTIV